MQINNYFITLKNRIDLLNKFLSDASNYKDLNNPFASTLPKTYVWVDDEKSIAKKHCRCSLPKNIQS